ncbi:hypothetical protein BT63DRAFT_429018 [Microthyrium microscopicum]|uniref:Transcription factor Rba50 n=1 Tax=Microthyrium microscopicum TaxID=703497 RepID=A0A6A6U0V2_9PEZI|nr:hypothetical protein BT63DRAFT_429018 [Microthyrium microscopicum]
MPTLRGERFHIPLDDDEVAPDEMPPGRPTGFSVTDIVGDIKEREASAPMPPSAPKSASGWPAHRRRYIKKGGHENREEPQESDSAITSDASLEGREKQEIDTENRQRLAHMSPEEIEQERQELLSQLNPNLVKKLLQRTNNSSPEDMSSQKDSQRPSASERKVSFAVGETRIEKIERRMSAGSHSISLPTTQSGVYSKNSANPPELHRASSSPRKVSFSLPDADTQPKHEPTASSHSLPTPPSEETSQSDPSRPSHSDRKVSFSIPEEGINNKENHPSATSHSVPLPDTPEESIHSTPSRSRRSSSNERKVSFSVPEHVAKKDELSSAVSHSIVITPDTSMQNTPSHSRQSSVSDRKVSFSVPDEISKKDELSSASSHSILVTPEGSIGGSPSHSRRSSSSDRRVSFKVPEKVAKKNELSTATSHSLPLATPPETVEQDAFVLPMRPSSSTNRKVSFAAVDDDDEDDRKSSASHHSLPSTPQFNPVPDAHLHEASVHFPRPPDVPELNPESGTFLDDLHQKFFPNLPHDPSKLDWLKPNDPSESDAYSTTQDAIDPKYIRFDFKGGLIPPSKSHSLPTSLGLHHHGDAPDAAGYTIAELAHLSRSTYPAQRCIAMQTMGRLLYRLGSGEFGDEKELKDEGRAGQRALLAHGLWAEVSQSHVLETILEESKKERGHQTSIAMAQEAVWNWQRGGGSHPPGEEEKTAAGASA